MSMNGRNMVGFFLLNNDKMSSSSFHFTQCCLMLIQNISGTCSGMTQETYFTTALSLYVVPTPHTFINDNYGSKVRAKDVMKAFGGEDIAFPQCKGSYLEGVSFCVQPRTGNRSPVSCPDGIKRELERNECKGMVTIERFFEVS